MSNDVRAQTVSGIALIMKKTVFQTLLSSLTQSNNNLSDTYNYSGTTSYLEDRIENLKERYSIDRNKHTLAAINKAQTELERINITKVQPQQSVAELQTKGMPIFVQTCYPTQEIKIGFSRYDNTAIKCPLTEQAKPFEVQPAQIVIANKDVFYPVIIAKELDQATHHQGNHSGRGIIRHHPVGDQLVVLFLKSTADIFKQSKKAQELVEDGIYSKNIKVREVKGNIYNPMTQRVTAALAYTQQ